MTDDLRLSAYHYEVPPELIAQMPLEKRDGSRLLALDRRTGAVAHRHFSDIVDYFAPGDCLVINRTKVVPARLFGKKETGGAVELLVMDPTADGRRFRVLLKPRLEQGRKILLPGGSFALVAERTGNGETVVEINGQPLRDILEEHGIMPLPPYIKRKELSSDLRAFDRGRYQTVYAHREGAIAAPTAGLHFTDDILAALRARGVTVADVVLHVGWGTFKPVLNEDITSHRMLPERYEVSAETAEAVNRCRARGGRLFAVGTTSVRTLETVADDTGRIADGRGATSIFVHPGYRFKAVDAMLTNLHLPHSTPLMMVSAFAGKEKILAAYREAIESRYRFFSYGDAMLIL